MLVGLLCDALHQAIVALFFLAGISRTRGFVLCFFETVVPLFLYTFLVCIRRSGGSAPLRRDFWCGGSAGGSAPLRRDPSASEWEGWRRCGSLSF
jgi:hypothetical protein